MLDKWIIAGGWTMIPIMLVEAFIIFLVIYNMVALKKEKFCPEDLKVTLLQLMAECRIRSAIEVAAGRPHLFGSSGCLRPAERGRYPSGRPRQRCY